MWSGTLGGLGLFLLGMLMLTDNLKSLAGHSIEVVLARATARPFMGLCAGILITALLQSSSATTLITVSLVGAGLLSFSRSLPVIFGANIGTTSTAWLVSLLGVSINLKELALPFVGLGALIRLFSRGRVKFVGLALAGFGLIFLVSIF